MRCERLQHQADLTHYTQFPTAACRSCFMLLFIQKHLYLPLLWSYNHSLALKWATQPKVTPEWHKGCAECRAWSTTALSIPTQPKHPLLKHCTKNPPPSTKPVPLCRDNKCQQKLSFSEKKANFSSLAIREFVEGTEVTALFLINFFSLLLKTSFMWTTEIVMIEGNRIQVNSLPNYKAIIHSHSVAK